MERKRVRKYLCKAVAAHCRNFAEHQRLWSGVPAGSVEDSWETVSCAGIRPKDVRRNYVRMWKKQNAMCAEQFRNFVHHRKSRCHTRRTRPSRTDQRAPRDRTSRRAGQNVRTCCQAGRSHKDNSRATKLVGETYESSSTRVLDPTRRTASSDKRPERKRHDLTFARAGRKFVYRGEPAGGDTNASE